MGSQTTHGFPYPVGTDRVMDGDNAIQALAQEIDDQLYGAAGGATDGPGMWLAATGTVLCTDASLTAVAGSSVVFAVYMKIGKTVFFMGEANTGGTAATNAAINLPNGLAGVPIRRYNHAGSLIAYGTTTPADQSYGAVMNTAKDRIVLSSVTAGGRALPASHGLRWSVTYEIT